MKTLYFDCTRGVAGDTLSTALLDLREDKTSFQGWLASAGSTLVSRNDGCIGSIIRSLDLKPKVLDDSLAVSRLLEDADSAVRDSHAAAFCNTLEPVAAASEIVAVCSLIDLISPEQVIASAVYLGGGQGENTEIMSFSDPAALWLLRGIPAFGDGGPLCTPVGAALIRYFSTAFGDMPVMKLTAVGYGVSPEKRCAAGCVRALLGETAPGGDRIIELTCNVDDMTAESLGFAMEKFFELGALEVYTVPIGMKKSRPGTLLCVMCRETASDSMIAAVFRHTTTNGVRESTSRRYNLKRTITTVDTTLGTVHIKRSEGYGVKREKLEYDDIAGIARENGLSLTEVRTQLEREFRRKPTV